MTEQPSKSPKRKATPSHTAGAKAKSAAKAKRTAPARRPAGASTAKRATSKSPSKRPAPKSALPKTIPEEARFEQPTQPPPVEQRENPSALPSPQSMREALAGELSTLVASGIEQLAEKGTLLTAKLDQGFRGGLQRFGQLAEDLGMGQGGLERRLGRVGREAARVADQASSELRRLRDLARESLDALRLDNGRKNS